MASVKSRLPRPKPYEPLFKKCDTCKYCVCRTGGVDTPTTCALGLNPQTSYDWYEEPQHMHFADKCPKYTYGPPLRFQAGQKNFSAQQQFILDLERTTQLISQG